MCAIESLRAIESLLVSVCVSACACVCVCARACRAARSQCVRAPPPQNNKELETHFYFDQKKVQANLNNDLESSLVDNELCMDNPFFVYSIDEIFKNQFLKCRYTASDYHLSRVDNKIYKTVNEPKTNLSVLQNKNSKTYVKQQFQSQANKDYYKDRSFYFLQKLKQKITGNYSCDSGKYFYLNRKDFPILRVINYYSNMLQFLVMNFTMLKLSLGPEETQILNQLLLFNLEFKEIDPQREIEIATNKGKNISGPLIAFDQITVRKNQEEEK